MKAVCLDSMFAYLPLTLPYDEKIKFSEENMIVGAEYNTHNGGQPLKTGYQLTNKECYLVFGVMFTQNTTRFLITDDQGYPGFFPADMFMLSDTSLGLSWEIARYSFFDQDIVIIGYPELCQKYENLRDLIMLKPTAIKAYLQNQEWERSML